MNIDLCPRTSLEIYSIRIVCLVASALSALGSLATIVGYVFSSRADAAHRNAYTQLRRKKGEQTKQQLGVYAEDERRPLLDPLSRRVEEECSTFSLLIKEETLEVVSS